MIITALFPSQQSHKITVILMLVKVDDLSFTYGCLCTTSLHGSFGGLWPSSTQFCPPVERGNVVISLKLFAFLLQAQAVTAHAAKL